MSQGKTDKPPISSLIKKGIPFMMFISFFPHDQTKAACGIVIGRDGDMKLKLVEDSIVGRAQWKDGFPLSYEIHESLKLTDRQLRECEMLFYGSLAFIMPKMLSEVSHDVAFFVPAFPAYVINKISMAGDGNLILDSIMNN